MVIDNNTKNNREILPDNKKSNEITNDELNTEKPASIEYGDIDTSNKQHQKTGNGDSSDDTISKSELQKNLEKNVNDKLNPDKIDVNNNIVNFNSPVGVVKDDYPNSFVKKNDFHMSSNLSSHVSGIRFVIRQINHEALTKVENGNIITIRHDTDNYSIRVIIRQVEGREMFYYKIAGIKDELIFCDLLSWLMKVLI